MYSWTPFSQGQTPVVRDGRGNGREKNSSVCGPANKSARPTSASLIVESSFLTAWHRHVWLPDSLLEESDTVCELKRQHRLESEVALMAGDDASGIGRECSGTVDQWKRPRTEMGEKQRGIGDGRLRNGTWLVCQQETRHGTKKQRWCLPSKPDTERGGLC